MSNTVYDPKWLSGYRRPNDRRWHRSKKYKPEHRKQKMLHLRREVRKFPQDKILRYLDDEIERRQFIRLTTYSAISGTMYNHKDILRTIRSVHKDLVRRLYNLRYYW